MSQVELAFLTRPVAGDSVPGMPMPTLPRAAELGLDARDQAAMTAAMVAA